MTMLKKALMVAIAGPVLAVAQPALASDQSPWLGAAGSGEVSAAYVSQNADRFYAGDTELDLPVDLELQTLFVGVSYAINDNLTIDAQFGHARSDFATVPGLSPRGGESGITDTKIGLRYSLYNADGAAVAVRAAAIIDGGYRTGSIASIGDGGNGLELALLAGKSFDSGFAISGEAGYRNRDNDIPNEWFGSATGSYAFNDVFGAYLGYQLVRTNGGLDIGGPGFSPPRFPEVNEEYNLAYSGLNFNFNDNWSASLGYGKKLDGRNTAKSDFWNVAAAYAF